MKIPQMNMKFIKIILKDFEILYKKKNNNNKNDYNNVKTCNVIIIDYIKRLDFFPKCIHYL